VFGDLCYHVTTEGRNYVLENSETPPKVSRAARRYLQWLEVGDCYDFGFGEWIKRGMYKEDAK
ncbi:unnamed protein product, partial [marine sediment metagenome]